MKKKLFTVTALFFSFLFLSFQTLAHTQNVQVYKNAKIRICGKDMMGCYAALDVGGLTDYLLDQNYAKAFLKKHGHLTSEKSKAITVKEVVVVINEEDGHFPNPTAKFLVAKVLKIIE